MKLNKEQFIDLLIQRQLFNSKAHATRVFNEFVNIINETLEGGDEVSISGLGKFYNRVVEAHKLHCALNNTTYDVPERTRICFKQTKSTKSN
jgi:nucleoid DNA-binding protein